MQSKVIVDPVEPKGPSIGYKIQPPEEMAGYTYMPGTLCVSRDALKWSGYSIQNDGNNAVVTFHEGRNAAAPVIMTVQSLANLTLTHRFEPPVSLDAGLFVLFDANTTSVTVFWRPRREREAG